VSWISNLFSKRGKTTALYQRGMKKAHAQDLVGAIADYTCVIDDAHSPADLRAMSLFNRALAYSIQKQYDEANADLERVLAIPETPANLKDATRQKLERIRKRSGEPKQA
jgi:tetratricopeptide (TPR) repeat protein